MSARPTDGQRGPEAERRNAGRSEVTRGQRHGEAQSMLAGRVVTRELETLGPAQCLRLLSSRYLGRLAYIADGRPHVIPMNYVLDGDVIVVRMDYGGTLEDVVTSRGVAFEVDHADFAYHTGWSVVAHGTAEEITAPEEVARMALLPLRPWAPGDRTRYVRVTPTTFTGRRITY